MEITINAIAHYENGHNEHFYQETEVSDEEFNTVKQCVEANDNELDTLETAAPALYEKLYSLFYNRAKELEFRVGSYRPIRTFSGQSSLYHRMQTQLSNISINLGE